MMQWRHRIHEMCHVAGACSERLVQDLSSCSRMSDRDDEASRGEFLNQFNAAVDLRRDGHHVNGCAAIEDGKGIEVVDTFEGAKVFAMERPALLIVNKGPFVVHSEDACDGFRILSLSFHELIDSVNRSLVTLGRIRHECRQPRRDSMFRKKCSCFFETSRRGVHRVDAIRAMGMYVDKAR